MLHAVADGETDPATLAALADQRLRATPEQLRDAFGACADLHPVYRRLVKLTLDELRTIEDHLAQLDQQMAQLLAHHHDAVQRLAEVPGLGVDSAQQIIAEVGASAAAFPSAKQLASWMGACPGNEESAGVELQSPLPQRQSTDAPRAESGRQRRGEGEGDDLRDRVSPARPAPRTRASHRCHRPPALSSDLEDSARGHSVRGTRPRRQRGGEEGAGAQDDPRTAKSRLSRRTAYTGSDGVSDFRPWLIQAG